MVGDMRVLGYVRGMRGVCVWHEEHVGGIYVGQTQEKTGKNMKKHEEQ